MTVFEASCVAAGLDAPEAEYQFHPKRKWRFDYFWKNYGPGIALEVEGASWVGGRHNRGRGFHGDLEKYREAAIMGIRVLRCTTKEFENGTGLELVMRAVEASKT